MPDNRNRLRDLIEAYTENSITEAGFDELCELLKTVNDAELREFFEHDLRRAPLTVMEEQKLARMLGEVLNSQPAGDRLPASTVAAGNQSAPIRSLRFLHSARWWAAACIILALGIGSYFLYFNEGKKHPEMVKTPELPNDVKAPGITKAIITTSDGKTVYLDSMANGILLQQNGVEIVKLSDGKIAYKGSTDEIINNTLINPRGSKVVDMTLADGSRVWLNAGSSVTFPVSFVGNERKVSITGEAYFEIAHDATRPFYVAKGDVTVQVLGTHFNVNAYADNNDIKVTLLKGSVKVDQGPASGILKPGQQAQVSNAINIVNNVDLEEVMAWKNGKFKFGDAADITTIMKEISRWYDMDIEYKGVVEGHIGGTISREVNVSQVFKMLEMTGAVAFEIEGKKATVMSK